MDVSDNGQKIGSSCKRSSIKLWADSRRIEWLGETKHPKRLRSSKYQSDLVKNNKIEAKGK